MLPGLHVFAVEGLNFTLLSLFSIKSSNFCTASIFFPPYFSCPSWEGTSISTSRQDTGRLFSKLTAWLETKHIFIEIYIDTLDIIIWDKTSCVCWVQEVSRPEAAESGLCSFEKKYANANGGGTGVTNLKERRLLDSWASQDEGKS